MSRPPRTARSSVASGLAPPPPPGYPVSAHGSSVFAPPPPLSIAPSALSRPQSRLEPPPLSATLGPMPGTRERPIHGPKKRLIVTCDGTWLNADNGLMNGHKQPPSNVSRIGWAIKDTSRDGIPQIVNYQAGVGSMGGPAARALGGATGMGLKENMRMAYTYLASNWRPGDEIFLIGFSRGAFTARSIGGMVGALGLLTRAGLPYFNEIFEDWEHRFDDRYGSKFPDIPFEGKRIPFDEQYVHELARRGLTTLNVPIKAICCWDTVGSLGIPRVPWLENIRLQAPGMHDYEFYDTRLHPCIENAYQALALDERRAPFSPALWEKRENNTTNLVQCWFPGVHSNVGGGYEDQELADITLAWMISKLEPFLDFRPNFLTGTWEATKVHYKETGQRSRWWSFGEIYNSMKGIYALAGSKTRTPGNYYRIDPQSGRPLTKRLRGTNEYFHASVRARLGLQGPGPQDRGTYNPPALRDWTFDVAEVGAGHGGNHDGLAVIWTNHSARSSKRGEKGGHGQDKIPEEKLSETELVLLRQSPRVYDFVSQLSVNPPHGKRKSRRHGGQNGMPNGPGPPPPGMSPYGQFPGGRPPPPGSFVGSMPPNGRRSGRSRSLNPDGLPDDSDDSRDRDRERRHRRKASGDPDRERRRRSRKYDEDE